MPRNLHGVPFFSVSAGFVSAAGAAFFYLFSGHRLRMIIQTFVPVLGIRSGLRSHTQQLIRAALESGSHQGEIEIHEADDVSCNVGGEFAIGRSREPV